MKFMIHYIALMMVVMSAADNMSEYKAGVTFLLQERIKSASPQNQEMVWQIVRKNIADMELCEKDDQLFDDFTVGEYVKCISWKFAECNKQLNELI